MINISREELIEFLKAWLAISLAFTILLRNMNIGLVNVFLISTMTVGIGIVLHELAHKLIAEYYRCRAEFKSDNKMLIAALLMAFLGFIFVVPGAVHIKGYVTRAQSGIISLFGPLTNLVLALLFIPFLYLEGLFFVVGYFGFMINSFLGLFNMIPFGPFDGAKVWIWNKVAYVVTAIILLIMTISSYLI
ncbi:MAG: metalloprotease [Candidatus Woesearchaeota archaeon]